MDISQVADYLTAHQTPSFRIRQILKSYYSGHHCSFATMSNLPLSLRSELDNKFQLLSVRQEKLLSSPNTQKVLLTLPDTQKIESVVMDYGNWITACVSSQVGCPLACKFCATGQMGFIRNLTAQEIVDQIIFWNYSIKPKHVGRVVFMGMGEPFLNWDNLIESLAFVRHDLKIGARKISVSTAGIVPRIYDFADLNTEINLAISLHSARQETRESLMPIAKQYPLDKLVKALDHYVQKTCRQVFFEYTLIKDVNDTKPELEALIKLIKSNKLFYLNLIPLNFVNHSLHPSPKLPYFQEQLTFRHVNFSCRASLGADISSACGQLTSGGKLQ